MSERFLWMASNLLLAGMVTLAIGVALDVYVVSTALTSSAGVGVALGGALLVLFGWLWLLLPRHEARRHG